MNRSTNATDGGATGRASMPTDIISQYDAQKGNGFIRQEDGSGDG